MKVKQLIKKLSKLNPNTEVILSSDAEGNNYSLLSEIYYIDGLKYSRLDGEIDIFDKSEIDEYFTEKDYNKGKNCIILYPR